MKNVEDLRVGDEVKLVVKAVIKHTYPEEGYVLADYANNAEYISIEQDYLNDGTVVIANVTKSLPNVNGVYVPGNNASAPEGSYLYIYDEDNEDGPWTEYNGVTVATGPKAEEDAKNAHETLGGLVLLNANR